MSSTEKETKTNNKKVVKKGMGAFRLSVEILDNLKTVSNETGIPASTIVTKCLGKERVVEIVKAELEKSLSKFKSLD
jgi:predicted DNA-binding protein|tara:strand:- start:203 stop:433 length:231 start_codon:yes stop_codon:yes gene_type:complete